MMMDFLKKIKNFILDTLFPISCFFCNEPDVWICPKCLEKINVLNQQVCPYCEKILSPSGKICQKCKITFLSKNEKVPLENLIVATKYRKNSIDRIVHYYKYNFIQDLSLPLGKIITKAIIENNLDLPDIIIPVPLHPRRLRWRGFNQSEILAEYVSKNLALNFSIPMIPDLLLRKKFTLPQMKIKNYLERKNNLKNAFALNEKKFDKNFLKNKKILLIDDISTTGSTLFECANILKSNGAKSVFGAVIARQEME